MISILVPIYRNIPNFDFLFDRCLTSIREQTYQDYEIVITEEGNMGNNTNKAIQEARGDVLKILFQDDYFTNKHALKTIVETFRGGWMASGCLHDNGKVCFNPHTASYEGIPEGRNTIGSPSVITVQKDCPLFNEELQWVLDVDWYRRLYEKYGLPTILDDLNVTIGIGEHQETARLSNELKQLEEELIK